MKKAIWIAVALVLQGSVSLAQDALKPADIDVDGLFDLVKARSARTVRFTFTQKISMMGKLVTGEGEGILKSPGKSRTVVRMSTPAGEMTTSVISDGETMWQAVKMPMGLQVVKYDVATLDAGTAAQVSGMGPWGTVDADRVEELKEQTMLQFDLQVGGMDEISGTPVYVVDLKPRPGAQGGPMPIDRMRIQVGAGDGFARTMDMYDKSGHVLMHFAVQDLTFDLEAPDSLFAYTPPPGTQVADGNAMVKKMKDAQAHQAGMLHKEAPDFTLKALDGKAVQLKSLRGKTVLIDFWASWCGPCKRALPHIQKLHDAFKGKGLVVLGINAEAAEVARKFMREKGYTFTTLEDEGGEVSRLYKVQGIPTTLVIDKDGIVQSYGVGYRPEAEVRAALAQAGVQ